MHSYNSMHNYNFVDCFGEYVCSCKCLGERGGGGVSYIVTFTYRHCVCVCVLSQIEWFVLSLLPSSEESNELLMIGPVRGGTWSC